MAGETREPNDGTKKPIVKLNESFKANYLKYKKKYLYTKQQQQQLQQLQQQKLQQIQQQQNSNK
jgi:hypothetical protein